MNFNERMADIEKLKKDPNYELLWCRHGNWLIEQIERLKKDKMHFMEMYSKECKSNEQNIMAYLGEKQLREKLKNFINETRKNNSEAPILSDYDSGYVEGEYDLLDSLETLINNFHEELRK